MLQSSVARFLPTLDTTGPTNAALVERARKSFAQADVASLTRAAVQVLTHDGPRVPPFNNLAPGVPLLFQTVTFERATARGPWYATAVSEPTK